jgi:quinol monooxygenase YgiN
MPVVTTAEYVVMLHIYGTGPAFFRLDPDTILAVFHVQIWPDPACLARGSLRSTQWLVERKFTVLVKVFPIKLKDGMQDKAEAVVQEFAPKGPGAEDGTLSFRVYRDPAKPDYLLFVEHFADQAAYDAHTSSPAYRDLIAGQFASMIVEFTELDHELVVGL